MELYDSQNLVREGDSNGQVMESVISENFENRVSDGISSVKDSASVCSHEDGMAKQQK